MHLLKGRRMTIRDALPDDLPEIASIMNHYRAHTTHIWDRTPVRRAAMSGWLREHTTLPYCALVAEEDGKVAGYASLSRFRPHLGYAKTAEDSIYLAPGNERGGIGTALMEALLCRAKQNGLRVVTAWIDSRNAPSVAFHEKMGFTLVGVMNNVGVMDGQPASVVIMDIELT
jgi:phosphinothricin acetyltransferase